MPTNLEREADLYKWLEEYSVEEYPSEHRHHLGVSIIGEQCRRKLWNTFRWTKLEHHDPRMRRLFNRGHEEEPRFIKILRRMGFLIRDKDPETGKQYLFSSVDGHYGGSGDTVAIAPWDWDHTKPDGIDETKRILVEYKTHNAKSFVHLKANKLVKSKPKHFAQMCGYGRAFKVKLGLYCGINKDTDEIYFELVDLDWLYAADLERKAAEIIFSQTPPAKIAENASFFDCKYCHFSPQCHHGERVEVNCRSCKHAQPIQSGQWGCNKFGQIIPKDFLKNGCPQHEGIV